MNDFYPYKRKNKSKKLVCPQSTVSTKDDFLKLRIKSNMKTRIMELSKEKGKSASELTRLLWQHYFDKVDKKAWQKEMEKW